MLPCTCEFTRCIICWNAQVMNQISELYTSLTVCNIRTATDHCSAIVFQKEVYWYSHFYNSLCYLISYSIGYEVNYRHDRYTICIEQIRISE